MLEQQIEKLTAALERVANALESKTEVLTANSGGGETAEAQPAKKKAPAKKPAKKAEPAAEEPETTEQPEAANEPQYSADDVKAKLSELAEKVGGAGPKGILKAHGIAKFSDMKPEQYDAVYADALAALDEAA